MSSEASPTDIEAPGWRAVATRVWSEMNADHVGLIAAGCAFYGLLALFPAVVAAMGIAGLVLSPDVVTQQLEQVSAVLPEQAARIVTEQAVDIAGTREGGLGLATLLGIGIAIYSASKAVQALTEGLNVAFEVEESRGMARLYATNIGLTLLLILVFFVVAAIAAVLPMVLEAIPGGGAIEGLAVLLRWPALLVVVALVLAVLYRLAPDRRARWRWLTPGAALASILWLIGSIAFAVYVRNFGSYQESFGTLGGVVVLLTWMWLSAFIVLTGAEFDSELERQGKRDPEGRRDLPPADEA